MPPSVRIAPRMSMQKQPAASRVRDLGNLSSCLIPRRRPNRRAGARHRPPDRLRPARIYSTDVGKYRCTTIKNLQFYINRRFADRLRRRWIESVGFWRGWRTTAHQNRERRALMPMVAGRATAPDGEEPVRVSHPGRVVATAGPASAGEAAEGGQAAAGGRGLAGGVRAREARPGRAGSEQVSRRDGRAVNAAAHGQPDGGRGRGANLVRLLIRGVIAGRRLVGRSRRCRRTRWIGESLGSSRTSGPGDRASCPGSPARSRRNASTGLGTVATESSILPSRTRTAVTRSAHPRVSSALSADLATGWKGSRAVAGPRDDRRGLLRPGIQHDLDALVLLVAERLVGPRGVVAGAGGG